MAKAVLSIRIDLPDGGRIGPGKAALMTAIAEAGSISGAARALGMSYPKAMRLVDELNTGFASPLILTEHGGHARGGARLSPAGEKVLGIYRKVTAAAEAAGGKELASLAAMTA